MRLLNKFRPGSISQIDPREDGILRRSNVMKFLASCSANGLPQEDIFLPNDLVEGTSHSLARVARTAIALVKWAEVSTPTYPHSSTDGGNINPENLPPFRPLRLPPKRPRVIIDSGGPTLEPHLAGSAHAATRESPPRRPPRSPRRPPPNSLPETAGAGDPPHMPSAGGAIANSRRDQPISSSGKSRTTSSSTKNQATKESSTTNQSMAPSTKSPPPSTMEIYPSIMNRSPTNQSLSNQSRVSLGSVHSHRTNDQSKISLRGISSHETNNQSRVSLGSMLSQWKNDQPMVSAGNILSHWTNNQPSIPSAGSILSRPRRTSFTASPRKGVTHSAKDISPPPKTLSIPPSSDSIAPPGIKRSISQQQNGAARRPIVNLDIVNGFVPESAHPPRMTWWYRVRQIFARLLGQPRHQGPLHSNLGHLRTRRHVFVDAAVNKCMSSPRSESILADYCALFSIQLSSVRETYEKEKGCGPMLPLLPRSPLEMRCSSAAGVRSLIVATPGYTV